MRDRSRAPRVLHVAHYVRPHVGGLETVVAAQTAGLLRRGWDVSVLASAWGAPPGTSVEDGVRVVRVRAWHGFEERLGAPFPVFGPGLVLAAWREVRRADVVHVHDPLYLSSWVAALWCRLLRTPYVVHRHVGVVDHTSPLVRLVQAVVLGTLARLVLGGALRVLPIDEPIAVQTRRLLRHPERVEVLTNGVDTALFRPPEPDERDRVRSQHGLPTDRPLLLFVGRFVPKKGFDAVLDALSDVYTVVLVGGDRPAGHDDPRARFLGALPPHEVAEVYRAVDALVVASTGERPLTVLEAMSSGLPLLLNDDPVLHSAWTDDAGVRYVDVAAGELRGAAERLLGDPALLAGLGAASAGAARAHWSWERHLDRLETAYRTTLGPTSWS